MFDFHIGDLDAPLIGLAIEDDLDVFVQLVALGKQLIELMLTEHRAERGLRKLAGSFHVILYVDNRWFGFHHTKVEYGIHLDRDVVAGNEILGRYVEDDGP